MEGGQHGWLGEWPEDNETTCRGVQAALSYLAKSIEERRPAPSIMLRAVCSWGEKGFMVLRKLYALEVRMKAELENAISPPLSFEGNTDFSDAEAPSRNKHH